MLASGVSLKPESSAGLKRPLAGPECSVRSQRIMEALIARGMTALQAKCLSDGGYG